MARVRVHNFSVSVDGYAAGPDQDTDRPLGVGGSALHEWIFQTRYGRRMIGQEGGDSGLDDEFMVQRDQGIGTTIMGRNMFGPIRGPWGDTPWSGWWGPSPPYHHPVFVLTHYPHLPIEMKGGTTFHFITGGVDEALRQALIAADGKDVLVGGGAATIRQYLSARLIDEIHLAVVPILLGRGEQLFESLTLSRDDYRCVEHRCSSSVIHLRFAKSAAG